VAAGWRHTLALDNDGLVFAWGHNTNGECNVPSQAAGSTRISSGHRHSIALACPLTRQLLFSGELVPFAFQQNPVWALRGIEPSVSEGIITVTARGEIGDATRFLQVSLDGQVVGTVFGAGSDAVHCMSVEYSEQIVVPAGVLAAVTADGSVDVMIVPAVNATSISCPDAALQVRIDYRRAPMDCDSNGLDDQCEIEAGAEDINANARLDTCELRYGDLNLDGVVDGFDLTALLAMWGALNPPYGDLDRDGTVGGLDLTALLARWGPVGGR
jgi:hypothetical protein